MKARPSKKQVQGGGSGGASASLEASEDAVDLSLLEESLAKTVWERMLPNDDALRLTELLQAAMQKARAKS